MEILSDAVFHGDVSIGTSTNPKTLKLYTNGNGNVLTIGETGGTEILKTDGIVKFENINANYANICSLTVFGNSSTLSIGFWSISDQYPGFYQSQTKNRFYFGQRELNRTYYIATQDQIPSRESFPFSNELPIDFDVPAECTRFYVHGALNGTPASIQMFKRVSNSGESGYKVVNVDLAWVCGSAVESDTKGCAIVVEKSSSFAMCSTDGYSIRTIYLPNYC